jgi:hypothetical protein
MSDAAQFDPCAYELVLGPVEVPLRPDLEEAAARYVEAFLVPVDAVPEGDPSGARGSAIARVAWRLVRYSAVEDAGADPMLFADSISGDLLETTRILFDEDGTLREFAGAAGNELLYFTSFSVEPGYDFFRVAVELLEHVIGVHGSGCFGAAYYRDAMPRLELERALRDRGFTRIEDEPLFFVSLEKRRPPLPDAK